jgi:hypothetical protein
MGDRGVADNDVFVFKTNLKCKACLQKITPLLDARHEIVDWQVDLTNPDRLLRARISSGDANSIINDELSKVGFVAVPYPIDSDPNHSVASDSSSTVVQLDVSKFTDPNGGGKVDFFSTYRPLLLVVAYVVGFSFLLSFLVRDFTAGRLMQNFTGGFFLGFSFFKFLDVHKFADAFASYDLLARRWRFYALAYPSLELGLGIAYVIGWQLVWTNVITMLLMGIGLIGVIRAIRSGKVIQCACLGTAFNLPMSVVTIIENSVMLVMAAYAIISVGMVTQ